MQLTTQPTSHNSIPLYSLFVANAISLVGNVFSLIAIPLIPELTLWLPRLAGLVK